MEADSLAPNLWNAISELVARGQSAREISIGRVTKRDTINRVIWLEEFGETAIPLVAFDYSFAYYDTTSTGSVIKREDKTDNDPAFRTKMLVPKVGQQAVILDMWGNRRFPVCVGIIQSKSGSYWQGET